MLRLIWKNLRRNKRRTILTLGSVTVSLFLLSLLAIVYTALGKPLQNSDNVPILMTHRSTGIMFMMPISHEDRIRKVPGVVAISVMNWFGGYWQDPAQSFANFAVDANTIFTVDRGAHIAPEQLAAFENEKTAAVAGRRLMEKFHWKIGDRITLMGSPYGVTPELNLVGSFSGGPDDQFYFHYDYFNEMLNRLNLANLFWVRIEKPEMASQVSRKIDEMFRNTDAETKTESLNNFLLSFVSLLGNVRGMILLIGSAVTFAILLIVANTMAMSIRERIGEAAILRAVGFRSAHIMGLFVGESALLTLAGALLGVGGARVIANGLALSQVTQFVFADFRMRNDTLLFCFSLAMLISLLASAIPAYRAAKIHLADALRNVS
jgi:putative ABC transport system permease protein